MSDLKQQLDVDIERFFDNIESQSHSDKKQTLKDIFEKYLHLTSSDYMMDYFDLNDIVGHAMTLFATETFPVHLGYKRKKVQEDNLRYLCLIESTVMHLNKKGCLKKIAKFDKREDLLDKD